MKHGVHGPTGNEVLGRGGVDPKRRRRICSGCVPWSIREPPLVRRRSAAAKTWGVVEREGMRRVRAPARSADADPGSASKHATNSSVLRCMGDGAAERKREEGASLDAPSSRFPCVRSTYGRHHAQLASSVPSPDDVALRALIALARRCSRRLSRVSPSRTELRP